MYEITSVMRKWNGEPGKKPLYAATVVSVEGSAVRRPGASMGIAADGSLTGSVSGGCIESTVITAVEDLRHRESARTITFCPDDDPFMGAPAPCGGTVRVCVYPYSPAAGDALERRMDSGKDGAWGIIVEGTEGTEGTEGPVGTSFALDEQGKLVPAQKLEDGGGDQAGRTMNEDFLIAELMKAPREGHITDLGGLQVFVQKIPLPPHVIVVGGSHIGEALVAVLKNLHWKVTVVEPREMFAPPGRFHAADRVLHLWPEEAFEELGLTLGLKQAAKQEPEQEPGFKQDLRQDPEPNQEPEQEPGFKQDLKGAVTPGPQPEGRNSGTDFTASPRFTAVAAITHTEQIDDAAVALGIRNRCFSVGVLGSTRTFSARISRLRNLGFTDEELGRVHGPIGLDIGAGTPEEIALAIAAEMVQDYRNAR